MRELFIDVTYEVPAIELQAEKDPTRFVLWKMRDSAERLCEEQGGRLRSEVPVETRVSRGVDLKTGADMILCASRWTVTAPERVEV